MSFDKHHTISLLDDNSLIFASGATIIAQTIDRVRNESSQRFLIYSENSMTPSFTVSPDRSQIIVAETHLPQISIYDARGESLRHPNLTKGFRKLKSITFHMDGMKLHDILFMSMSNDGKWIVVLMAEPVVQVLYASTEKGRVFACEKLDVTDIDLVGLMMNPYDSGMSATIDRNAIYFKKYTEMAFTSSQIIAKVFVWLNETQCAFGTQAGEIHVYSMRALGEPMQILKVSNEFSVDVMTLKENELITALSSGELVHFEISKSEENVHDSVLEEKRRNRIPGDAVIPAYIVLSQSEATSLIITNIFEIVVSEATETVLQSKDRLTIQIVCLTDPYHVGAITSIDTCVRRPILATCGVDKSIRIWNYTTNKVEISRYFPDEPLSCSLHPSGFYVAVGFSDKLRLYNLFATDLKVYAEFNIRSSKEFSNGGHLIAVCHGNSITLFSTWMLNQIGQLKGHMGRVRSISWSADDSSLISSSQDGTVYTWNIRTLKRKQDYILKSCQFSGAISNTNGSTLYAVGSDSSIKEIRESNLVTEVKNEVGLTCVELSRNEKMLFVGTAMGGVRSIRFPLMKSGAFDEIEWQEHAAHAGHVEKIKLSYDDSMIFSVGSDGCLFCFKITTGNDAQFKEQIFSTSEVLISKTEMEETQGAIVDLMRYIDEIKLEHDYQLRLKDVASGDQLKAISKQYSVLIDSEELGTGALRSSKDNDELRFDSEITRLKQTASLEYRALEMDMNTKLIKQYEKLEILQTDYISKQKSWHSLVEKTEAETTRLLNLAQSGLESRMKSRTLEAQKISAALLLQSQECKETIQQTEMDIDVEYQNLFHKYEAKMYEEKNEYAKLKGDNGIMNKKFGTLIKDIEECKNEISTSKDNGVRLIEIVGRLVESKAVLHKETIQEKEKRVFDLKKKNQELEKYKFVLDYRIKELKLQMEPKEKQMSEMAELIIVINEKLETANAKTRALKQTIIDSKATLVESKQGYLTNHARVKDTRAYLNGMKRELEDVIKYFQDIPLLRKSVTRMAAKYVFEKHGGSEKHSSGKAKTARNEEQQLERFNKDALMKQSEEHEDVEELDRQTQFLQIDSKKIMGQRTRDSEKFVLAGNRGVDKNKRLLVEIDQLRKKIVAKDNEKNELKVAPRSTPRLVLPAIV